MESGEVINPRFFVHPDGIARTARFCLRLSFELVCCVAPAGDPLLAGGAVVRVAVGGGGGGGVQEGVSGIRSPRSSSPASFHQIFITFYLYILYFFLSSYYSNN